MYLIVIGTLLVILKLADVASVGAWSWWVVLAPFGAAVVWWAWADASGYTKRREIDIMDAKKKERRRKNLEALGMDAKGRRGR
jgi:small Trp-rich protein